MSEFVKLKKKKEEEDARKAEEERAARERLAKQAEDARIAEEKKKSELSGKSGTFNYLKAQFLKTPSDMAATIKKGADKASDFFAGWEASKYRDQIEEYEISEAAKANPLSVEFQKKNIMAGGQESAIQDVGTQFESRIPFWNDKTSQRVREAARRQLEKESAVGTEKAMASRSFSEKAGTVADIARAGTELPLYVAAPEAIAARLPSIGARAATLAGELGTAGAVGSGYRGTDDYGLGSFAIDAIGAGVASRGAKAAERLSNKSAVKELSESIKPAKSVTDDATKLVDDGTVIDFRPEPVNSPVSPKADEVLESTSGLPTDKRIKAVSESGLSPEELNQAYESLDQLTKDKILRETKEANALKNQVNGTEAIDADAAFLKSAQIPGMKAKVIHRKPLGGDMVSYESADGKTKFHEPVWKAQQKGIDITDAKVVDYLPNKSSVNEVGALLRQDGLGSAKVSNGAKNAIAEALGTAFRADRQAEHAVELPLGTAKAENGRALWNEVRAVTEARMAEGGVISTADVLEAVKRARDKTAGKTPKVTDVAVSMNEEAARTAVESAAKGVPEEKVGKLDDFERWKLGEDDRWLANAASGLDDGTRKPKEVYWKVIGWAKENGVDITKYDPTDAASVRKLVADTREARSGVHLATSTNKTLAKEAVDDLRRSRPRYMSHNELAAEIKALKAKEADLIAQTAEVFGKNADGLKARVDEIKAQTNAKIKGMRADGMEAAENRRSVLAQINRQGSYSFLDKSEYNDVLARYARKEYPTKELAEQAVKESAFTIVEKATKKLKGDVADVLQEVLKSKADDSLKQAALRIAQDANTALAKDGVIDVLYHAAKEIENLRKTDVAMVKRTLEQRALDLKTVAAKGTSELGTYVRSKSGSLGEKATQLAKDAGNALFQPFRHVIAGKYGKDSVMAKLADESSVGATTLNRLSYKAEPARKALDKLTHTQRAQAVSILDVGRASRNEMAAKTVDAQRHPINLDGTLMTEDEIVAARKAAGFVNTDEFIDSLDDSMVKTSRQLADEGRNDKSVNEAAELMRSFFNDDEIYKLLDDEFYRANGRHLPKNDGYINFGGADGHAANADVLSMDGGLSGNFPKTYLQDSFKVNLKGSKYRLDVNPFSRIDRFVNGQLRYAALKSVSDKTAWLKNVASGAWKSNPEQLEELAARLGKTTDEIREELEAASNASPLSLKGNEDVINDLNELHKFAMRDNEFAKDMDGAVRAVQTLGATVALGAKVSPVLKQPLSLFDAVGDFGVGNVLWGIGQGLSDFSKKRLLNLGFLGYVPGLSKFSPETTLGKRIFDTSYEIRMRAGAGEMEKRATYGKTNGQKALHSIKEAPFRAIQWMDTKISVPVWLAAAKDEAQKMGVKVINGEQLVRMAEESDEFATKVGNRFKDVMSSVDKFDAPKAMRKSPNFMSLFTFMQKTANNRWANAARVAKRSRADAVRAYTMLAVGNAADAAVTAGLMYAWNAMGLGRESDKTKIEENRRRYTESFVSGLTSTIEDAMMAQLGAVPFAGRDLVPAVKGTPSMGKAPGALGVVTDVGGKAVDASVAAIYGDFESATLYAMNSFMGDFSRLPISSLDEAKARTTVRSKLRREGVNASEDAVAEEAKAQIEAKKATSAIDKAAFDLTKAIASGDDALIQQAREAALAVAGEDDEVAGKILKKAESYAGDRLAEMAGSKQSEASQLTPAVAAKELIRKHGKDGEKLAQILSDEVKYGRMSEKKAEEIAGELLKEFQ